jgi:hypothetical protein
MRERLEELLVLLPEVKKRALFDLYREIKRLEISQRRAQEAAASLESMRVQVCCVCVCIPRSVSISTFVPISY